MECSTAEPAWRGRCGSVSSNAEVEAASTERLAGEADDGLAHPSICGRGLGVAATTGTAPHNCV